jgi:hypothetical protein
MGHGFFPKDIGTMMVKRYIYRYGFSRFLAGPRLEVCWAAHSGESCECPIGCDG